MPTVGGYNIPAADKEAIEELKRLRNNWEFILAPGAPPVGVGILLLNPLSGWLMRMDKKGSKPQPVSLPCATGH